MLSSISQYGSQEVEDKEIQTDDHLEDMEPHKNVILHLLSQLKLGMDLTRVCVTTLCHKKSLTVKNLLSLKCLTVIYIFVCIYV